MRIHAAVALLALSALPGCVSGAVFHHTVRPLDLDLDATTYYPSKARGDMQAIHYRVRVEWGGFDIGSVAKDYGIEEIYYADVEHLSVLGIYRQTWVHVYGAP